MSRPRLIGLLLALVTLLLYLPAGRFPFLVYDDEDYVTANPIVQKGLTWDGVKWAFTTGNASNWHPLTWLSHMLDCQLFGMAPGPQHLVNVLFHTVNAVLWFVLWLRLTRALWPSALVAALFAWHPLHIESVAWIAERKDVLSTFFGLLSLLCYAKAVTRDTGQVTGKETESAPTGLRFTLHASRFYWLSLVFFALGLMSKPMLVTLPFVMLLLDYWPLNRVLNFGLRLAGTSRCDIPARAVAGGTEAPRHGNVGARTAQRAVPTQATLQCLVVEKIPFFLLAAISCVVTFQVQHAGGAVISLAVVPLRYRLVASLIAYLTYFWKTLWPTDLAIFYPVPEHLRRSDFAEAIVFLIVISGAVWRARRAYPYLLMGWLWFLGTLVPVIGLVQVGGAAWADRYMYLPSIGLFVAFAFGLRALAERSRLFEFAVASLAALVLVACVLDTQYQLRFWRDSETLFRRALEVTRNNDIAHDNLGVALEQQGRYPEALEQYRAAAQIAPWRYQIHNNLGNLLDKMGKREEALAEYREAVRLDPRFAFLHNSLGIELDELGRYADALNEFTNALRLVPDYAWPHVEIAKTLLKQGRDAEAIDQFRTALRLDPDNFQILAETAHVLAADENPQGRDGHLAVALATKANELSGHSQPVVFDILGMAFAACGDFSNAQVCAQNALDLATAAKMKNLDEIRRRLQLYQDHEPWRELFRGTNGVGKTE